MNNVKLRTRIPDLEVMRGQVKVWRVVIEAEKVGVEAGDQGGGQTQVDAKKRGVMIILKIETLYNVRLPYRPSV